MALDLLSAPAMSSEDERLFSHAKLTVTSQRHGMKARTLEMLQMVKAWDRSGIFKDVPQVSIFFV